MVGKKHTALILGSGSSRGLAHIGVIKVLEENHVPIDIITGTSIGALIGGCYAMGMDVSMMEKIVHQVHKTMVAKILMPKFFAPGFIGNKGMIAFINELTGQIKIEDLKILFASVATDLITGEEVIFNKGLLSDAIMASMAIPTLFQPVLHEGRYLIDGALSNPLPISVALEMNAHKTIAVNVSPNPQRITWQTKNRKTEEVSMLSKKLHEMFSNLLNENKQDSLKSENIIDSAESSLSQIFHPTLMHVFLQSISISTNNLITQHLRLAKPDVLISPEIENFDMFEFYNGIEIIKCGYNEAIKSLPSILSLSKAPSGLKITKV